VDGPVGGDPAGREQAEDERTQDVPSGAVLPLGGSGPAAEPDGVAGEATGALVSPAPDRASDQDGPPAPMTDTVDQADDVHEPVEAQVAPAHTGTGPAAAPAAFAGAAALALTLDAPHPEPDDFPSTDPDVLFDSPPEAPAVEPAPSPDDVAAAAPAAVPPLMSATETPAPEASATAAAPSAQAEPPGSTTAPPPAAPATARPGATEPTRRTPRDPVHLAAEQAAADLALLRTFGDPAARPERAPIVALEGTTRPESPRPLGSAQPVRFLAVRRDGTEVAGAGVVLLDDRGHEVGTGRSAAGELTAPHPGAYVLVATAPDHQPGAVALAVGDAPVDADVLLARSAALVGVVSGEDGPLTGARVTLVQDGEVVDVAETDADGAYLVADLASGEYAVSVAAAGCDADVVLVVVADEAECVHDVELDPAGVPAG
ncbi:MAG: carboxypeptidase-like regulatory domain-containing protein, partial [Pseudonocardia sp.]|nr:carboxypeptidase-like regulatory domain-containing protein [Pseudonocardia sp.]